MSKDVDRKGHIHKQLHRVGNRDNWKCVWCGRRVYCQRCHPLKLQSWDKIATRDHEVPKSKGGSDEDINIVIACKPCNTAKADLTWKLGVARDRQPTYNRGLAQYQRRKHQDGHVSAFGWPDN